MRRADSEEFEDRWEITVDPAVSRAIGPPTKVKDDIPF